MKKAANLVLYLAYAALILAHPHLNQMLREYVAKTFSMTLPMLLAPALYIAATLILLLRTHLAERTFTPQNVLIQGAYVAVTIALPVYCFFHQMSSLLPALLTETVFDLVLLFIRRNHSPSE